MIFSWKFISDIVAPAICICWTAYIAFGALLGPTGYVSLTTLEKNLIDRQLIVADLEVKHDLLEAKANLLNPRSLDPDIVDEKIRSVLGYTRSGDIVILRAELDRLVEEARQTAP